MKHSLAITLIVLAAFLLAQFIGLAILYKYIDPVKSQAEGKVVFKELPIGERPPLEEKTSFIPIMAAVLIGTILLLILIKYDLQWIWKFWFLLAVVISLTVVFGAFVPAIAAFIAAGVIGIWKVFKPNVIIQNLTELFIYGGLASIFVPVLNLFSIIVLLILISGYDAYAVWKSKHMITLAQSQAKSKIFAGLLIPYGVRGQMQGSATKTASSSAATARTAVLGGGDIGFPLLFAGVLLKEFGLWQSLVIPVFTGAALFLLLWYGKEKKFYPAMPFISLGCFVGLGVVMAVQVLL